MILEYDALVDLLNLGSPLPALETQYRALLAAADSALKLELDRDIEQSNYVEYYNGNGTRYLVLKHYPVTAVTEVKLDFSGYFGHGTLNPFDSTSVLVDGSDYVMQWDDNAGATSNSGILLRLNTVWSELTRAYTQGKVTQEVQPALGNIKVTYTAGYSPVPADLQWACALLVVHMKQQAVTAWPLEAEKIGEYSYKLAVRMIKNVPGSFASTIKKYKRTPW